MRTEARTQGRIESGFERAVDGWHVVKFLEGIDYLKKKIDKGEELATNKQGDKLWKIPLVVDDPEDESHEVGIDVIAAENKKGEQTVVDFLGATNLFAKFAKAFPGDVSVFEDKIINKVKTSLPGQYMHLKTKQNEYKDKEGKAQIAVNVVGYGPMSKTVEVLEAELFPGKEEKGKAGKGKPAAAAPVAEDEDF